MSADTLAGASKRDVATMIGIGFMALFGVIIVIILFKANYTVAISGNLDANLIWGTFIGIIMSVMAYLGFKNQRNGNTPPAP